MSKELDIKLNLPVTRSQVLGRKRKIESVPAPEFGDGSTLSVKQLSGTEFMAISKDPRSKTDQNYLVLLAASICDPDGATLFTTDDIDAIGELPFTLLNRLIDVSGRLNGTGDDSKK